MRLAEKLDWKGLIGMLNLNAVTLKCTYYLYHQNTHYVKKQEQ
jgi:hypothetical protein